MVRPKGVRRTTAGWLLIAASLAFVVALAAGRAEPTAFAGACDTSEQAGDPDNDGLTNGTEGALGTDPCVGDTDGDGIKDGYEVNDFGTDPLLYDTDEDGLADGEEVDALGTDALDADSDDDGLSDGDEVNTHATDALDPDTDADGLTDGQEVNGVASPKPALGTFFTDPLEPDTDGDGCSDGRELGTDPALGGLRDPTNEWDFYDTDGDGKVSLLGDIMPVVARYQQTADDPDYDDAFDRGPPLGPNSWNLSAADGHISFTVDVLGVARQWQHRCV